MPGPLLVLGLIPFLVLAVYVLDRSVLRRRRQAHQAVPVTADEDEVEEPPSVQEDHAGEVEEDPGDQVEAAIAAQVEEYPGSRVAAVAAAQATETPDVQADTAPPDLTGRILGQYEVQEKIGVGGMAVVYKGVHTTLDRPVAIKVLGRPLNEADLPDLARRFQREARTVAALRHPHIVQVFDYGAVDGTHYLVMEYVEGSDLRAAMKLHKLAKRPWTPDEILTTLEEVGSALDYAHAQGVVHRDVKPANVLISPAGEHILTDFGLSAIRKTRTTLISTLGQPFGTPEYVAPEQATDYKKAGPQSDLYSLGCVAYELISGHLPFEAETPLAIALMHVSSDPMLPSFHVPDLPRAVDNVILRVLDKEPERRYQTARAFVEALRRAWVPGLLPELEGGNQARERPKIQARATTGPVSIESESAEAPEILGAQATVAAGKVEEQSGAQASSGEYAHVDPAEIDLTPTQARMILWAIEHNDARLSRGNVQQKLGLSERRARTLMKDWTEQGWLLRASRPRQPASVSTELANLARIRLGKEPE